MHYFLSNELPRICRMSTISDEGGVCTSTPQKKYIGVRRRKWGKWVSEIRVPSTQERLWLGSYSTPEGAAIAHDVAFFCLRGTSLPEKLNFPSLLPAGVRTGLSPRAVQNAASNAGMAMDAQFSTQTYQSNINFVNAKMEEMSFPEIECWETPCNWSNQYYSGEGEDLSISVEDYL